MNMNMAGNSRLQVHTLSFFMGMTTVVTVNICHYIFSTIPNPTQIVLNLNLSQGEVSQNLPTFLSLALAANTSKVGGSKTKRWRQRYDCLYESALTPYRFKKGLKLLELGLGCGMWYGTGASHSVWTKYFSDVTIYYLEQDEKCGREWHSNLTKRWSNGTGGNENERKVPIMTYGNEEDLMMMRKMVSDHGPWDIIIGDASHHSKHQISSFKELFDALNPSGIYFIEDINYASFFEHLGGTRNGLSDGRTNTTISFIAQVFASSILREGVGTNLERLTCCDAICGFESVGPGGQPRIGPKSYIRVSK